MTILLFLFLFCLPISFLQLFRTDRKFPVRSTLPNEKKIFAQILLTFRYGRDDEEVMGLKLSNESVLCVEQIYPLLPGAPLPQPITKCQVFQKINPVTTDAEDIVGRSPIKSWLFFSFQEVLMKRLGPNAHLINLKLTHTVPASVRLLPAKEYRGAAIGINYDLRIYTGKV